MSYILDALKKAESERRLGASPTVYTAPAFAAPERRQSAWRNPWLWTAVSALPLALVGIVWFAATRTIAPATLGERPAESQTRLASAQPPAPPAAASDEPVVKPKEKTARKTVEKKRTANDRAPKARQAPAPAEAPIATLRELPGQIQREIPALMVSGYIYSGNKADRSVLINKRLMREGDEVAPGLTLEKMTPSGMVLNYKGYRYRTSY